MSSSFNSSSGASNYTMCAQEKKKMWQVAAIERIAATCHVFSSFNTADGETTDDVFLEGEVDRCNGERDENCHGGKF